MVELLSNGFRPEKATEGSVGYDLRLPQDLQLEAGTVTKVPLAFKMSLPKNTEAQIRSRSGKTLAGLTVANSPGTIDFDFRGEVCVILRAEKAMNLPRGTAVAQMVFAKTLDVEIVDPPSGKVFDNTERGEQGFGSTG